MVMDAPSFNLGVGLAVNVVLPLQQVTSHEKLGSKLGLDASKLDAKCMAVLTTLNANLNLLDLEEAHAIQAAQFLSEDLEFQWVLAEGGSNPSHAIDHWAI